ncbi:MAG: hypothetical protein OEZ31_00360 [Nitrospirota bacterium]|nr:hypothetical protein [Nitrospirota bacterium]MDH5767399.1 hypothetical protein [Nitrospirota bacterium]
MSEDAKEKILEFLKGVGGKGVATQADIIKGTKLDRDTVKKAIKELALEEKIIDAGVAAGVVGFKIKT